MSECAATPHDKLIAEICDSRVAKTEREHAAGREIERLRSERDALTEALRELRDCPEGWAFHSADFSMNASCKSRDGRVTLVRDIAGRDWWHSLPDEEKERVPLFVYGSGKNISDAIKDAAGAAAKLEGKQ